jgi:hypothetical protein
MLRCTNRIILSWSYTPENSFLSVQPRHNIRRRNTSSYVRISFLSSYIIPTPLQVPYVPLEPSHPLLLNEWLPFPWFLHLPSGTLTNVTLSRILFLRAVTRTGILTNSSCVLRQILPVSSSMDVSDHYVQGYSIACHIWRLAGSFDVNPLSVTCLFNWHLIPIYPRNTTGDWFTCNTMKWWSAYHVTILRLTPSYVFIKLPRILSLVWRDNSLHLQVAWPRLVDTSLMLCWHYVLRYCCFAVGSILA